MDIEEKRCTQNKFDVWLISAKSANKFSLWMFVCLFYFSEIRIDNRHIFLKLENVFWLFRSSNLKNRYIKSSHLISNLIKYFSEDVFFFTNLSPFIFFEIFFFNVICLSHSNFDFKEFVISDQLCSEQMFFSGWKINNGFDGFDQF